VPGYSPWPPPHDCSRSLWWWVLNLDETWRHNLSSMKVIFLLDSLIFRKCCSIQREWQGWKSFVPINCKDWQTYRSSLAGILTAHIETLYDSLEVLPFSSVSGIGHQILWISCCLIILVVMVVVNCYYYQTQYLQIRFSHLSGQVAEGWLGQ